MKFKIFISGLFVGSIIATIFSTVGDILCNGEIITNGDAIGYTLIVLLFMSLGAFIYNLFIEEK
jgi:hypothetical protein